MVAVVDTHVNTHRCVSGIIPNYTQRCVYGIKWVNEMEDTNESTNLRKLADVWMSKNRCCQGHRNRSAVSVTRITVDIGRPSQEEEEVNLHRFRSQICRKMSVFTKLHGHKTIEVEFRIRVERPLLPRSR